MPDRFHHEDLIVYRKAITFVGFAYDLLQSVASPAAVKDQLKRAAESIPVNIAGSNAHRSAKEQRRLVDIATGSTGECASCLDVLHVKKLCESRIREQGHGLLMEIYRMLFGLRRAKDGQLCEDTSQYGSATFGFEKLEVYRQAVEIVRWHHDFMAQYDLASTDRDALDRYTTSMVLNIAEGNAMPSRKEKGRYLDSAMAAGLRAASALDVLVARRVASGDEAAGGKAMLARAVSMLLSLQKQTEELL